MHRRHLAALTAAVTATLTAAGLPLAVTTPAQLAAEGIGVKDSHIKAD